MLVTDVFWLSGSCEQITTGRPSSGVAYCWNSFKVCRPKLARFYQKQYPPGSCVLDEPEEKLTAVNVLPLPVAIWMSERGLFSESECSSPFIASTWHSRRPTVAREGISLRRARSISGSRAHPKSVPGR
jgi:hypothetical protein